MKGLRMPDLALRDRTLLRLMAEVERHDRCRQLFGEEELSTEIRAKHLQGVFFNSGSIQLAECVSHVLVEASRHLGAAADSVLASEAYLDSVLTETLRLYPLFGFTNRVATRDIHLEDGKVIKSGQQILIDFMRHHRAGYKDPEKWQPERWAHTKTTDSNYMPFGVGPRKCPAERFSRLVIKRLVATLVQTCHVHSPTQHFRSLDGGGLAVLVRRSGMAPPPPLVSGLRAYVRLRDTFDQFHFYATKLRTFPRIVEAARWHARRNSRKSA